MKLKWNDADGIIGFSRTNVEVSKSAKQKNYVELQERRDADNEGKEMVTVLTAIAVTQNTFDNKNLKKVPYTVQYDALQIRPKVLFYDKHGQPYYRTREEKVYVAEGNLKEFEKRLRKLSK